MTIIRRHRLEIAFIIVALGLQAVPLPPGWIESGYANGLYPALARTFVPLANAIPMSVGDILLVTIVAGIIAYWVVAWRKSSGSRLRSAARIALRTVAVAALIVIWFDAAWALNYRRSPIVRRVDFDPARVTQRNVSRLSSKIVGALNATAPLAHARPESEAQLETALRRAFLPVVRRLGDRYDVVVSRPKTTALNTWFAVAGIGGMWDPFAYETLLNADFLPFERPFALAHEWGHVAGFGDESDANLIAALTTLRSDDPLVRYSGLFWAYAFLPESDRRRLTVSALVQADLAAARERFLRRYNPRLFALQWFVYDKYLRANRVSAGIMSYTLFVQVLVGTQLDRAGLPLTRRPSAVRRSPQDAD